MPPEGNKSIGIWGQRHLQYIKNCKRVLYTSLLTSYKLKVSTTSINVSSYTKSLFPVFSFCGATAIKLRIS
ncbi:MAG: TnpV protein [Blautia sp.]